jgi:hypothetical protein
MSDIFGSDSDVKHVSTVMRLCNYLLATGRGADLHDMYTLLVQLRQHMFHTEASNDMVGMAMETWSCSESEQLIDLCRWILTRFAFAFRDWHVLTYGITTQTLELEGYGDIVQHRQRAFEPYCRLLSSTLHLIMNNLLFWCAEPGDHHEVCAEMQLVQVLLYNRPSYEDMHYVLPLKLIQWSFNEFGKRYSSDISGDGPDSMAFRCVRC